MCLFLLLLFFGPRSVIVIWWFIQPLRWDAVFHSFLLPFLDSSSCPGPRSCSFLVEPGGLVGLDFLWLGLAMLADIASYARGSLYGRRRTLAA